MNPSYEKSTFKIYLPSYLEFDDHVQISFDFECKKGQTDKIIYSKAILSDRFGVEHSDEGHEHYSNVMNSLSPFRLQPLVHMKNIIAIEQFLNPLMKNN